MTPFSFEWLWNLEYFIFMGLLYLALFIVGCGLFFVYIKTWLHLHEEEKQEAKGTEISSRSKYARY